jgi:hypothetical protein
MTVLGTVIRRHHNILGRPQKLDFGRQRTPVMCALDGAVANVTLFENAAVAVVVIDWMTDGVKDVHLRVMKSRPALLGHERSHQL